MRYSVLLGRVAPFVFVAIWSTGFVVARWSVPHAAPQLFLLSRMTLAGILMACVAVASRKAWPRGRRLALHLVAGMLLNGLYLCTSWWAIGRGMPAGVMALLGALQPLVVAVGSFAIFGERLSARGWAGLGIGMAGVVMVLAPLLGAGIGKPMPVFVVAAAAASILAMAAGTMIQSGALAKDGMLVSSAVQNCGGALIALSATVAQGDYRWDFSPTLWTGLGWSVLMLSLVALSLLVWMTRHQGATRVSVLLLLVPPLAAVEARLLFAERLSLVQMVGFALALAGVLLARSRRPVGPSEAA